MPRAGGLDRPADPIHHDRILGQAAFADLTPADQVAPLGIDELLDPADEVALQLMLGLQAFLFHASLAAGAFLPVVLGHLVTADVNILAGKELTHLREHVLQELEGLILACAIDSRKHAPFGVRAIGPAVAAQLGKRRERSARMPWHFDLRHDGDVLRTGIGHKLADVVLRVIPPIPSIPAVSGASLWVSPEARVLPPR